MSNKKKRWELLALSAIITMMAMGFLGTLVMLFISPDIHDPFIEENQPEEQTNRVREKPLPGYQFMNVHTLGVANSPFEEVRGDSDKHNELIPEIPDAFDASRKAFDPMLDARMSMAVLNKQQAPEEDDLLDEDEKDETGWGWLADDIAKRRSAKEEAAENDSDAEGGDENSRLAEEDEIRRGSKEKEKSLYFMDTMYETASERPDPFMRPAMQGDETSGDNNEQSSDTYADNQDAYGDDQGSTWDGSANKRKGDSMAIRDPFTADRESSSSFGNQQWGMKDDQANFSGMNYTIDDDGYKVTDETRYNYGNDDQSFRVVEAAGFGSDARSSRAEYFASDSMFNSGGGYQPEGVRSYSGDSSLSGSGLFGGSSASVVTPTINSSVGIGSSGASSYRQSSSPFSTRDDSALPTPKTLGW